MRMIAIQVSLRGSGKSKPIAEPRDSSSPMCTAECSKVKVPHLTHWVGRFPMVLQGVTPHMYVYVKDT